MIIVYLLKEKGKSNKILGLYGVLGEVWYLSLSVTTSIN